MYVGSENVFYVVWVIGAQAGFVKVVGMGMGMGVWAVWTVGMYQRTKYACMYVRNGTGDVYQVPDSDRQ